MAPRKSSLYERPAPPDFGPEPTSGGRYALALVFTLLLIAGLAGIFWAVYSMGVTARSDGESAPSDRAAVRVTPRPLTPARPNEDRLTDARPAAARSPASEPSEAPTGASETGADDAPPAAAAISEAASSEPAIDPKVLAWGAAGELAAELESQFDCSEFAVRPAADGGPRIEGALARPADIDQAKAMIEAKLPGAASLKPALGCTLDLGGNYSAVADKAGDPRLVEQADITSAIWAVLPGAQFCETLGAVVETLPRIRRRFAADEALAIWVTRNDRPARCSSSESGWTVETPQPGGSARAVALIYNGDLLAVSAKAEPAPEPAAPSPSEPDAAPAPQDDANAAETASIVEADAPPPPTPRLRPERPEPQATSDVEPEPQPDASSSAPLSAEPSSLSVSSLDPPPPSVETETATSSPPAASARRSVAPFAPPAGVMPADVDGADQGAAVQLEFTVRADGRAETFLALDAAATDVRVIAAAVEALSSARFPSPQPSDDGAYRGVYTVYLAPNPRSVAVQASPVFARSLTSRDMDAVYPRRAQERRQGGDVDLDCVVNVALGLDCTVFRQEPANWGFGDAGIAAARRLRVEPTLNNGEAAVGHRFTLSIEFAPPK